MITIDCRKTICLLLGVTSCFAAIAQVPKPTLVVGIVVDQMRAEQLYRYQSKFSQDGFKRLMSNGFNYKNAQYNYTPTVTSAGHASIYTGTTPSGHGIVSNSWYDRTSNNYVQSVEDTEYSTVGSRQAESVGASPKNMLTTTISDQIKLSSQLRSKVISISLKDRAAVLSGGHLADGVYWQDTYASSGGFITSSYYNAELPQWVEDFNAEGRADAYLDSKWTPLFDIESYTESYADDNTYEIVLGEERAVFPYDFKVLREKYRPRNLEYLLLGLSPFGNTLVTEFALEALERENLGKNGETDVLSISYSATDKVGHLFGPDSVELADVYVRLDREIAALLSELDRHLGKEGYVVFLTSDHGAIPVASYLENVGIPTDVARISQYKSVLQQGLNKALGQGDWLQHFSDNQVYLNRPLIREKGLALADVQRTASDILVELDGIREALTATNLRVQNYTNHDSRHLAQNGYYQKRSGDVVVIFESGVIQDDDSDLHVSLVKGTVHGSGYAYDTHVPLLIMGAGLNSGQSVRRVSPTDIASTIAMILNIQPPSGNRGEPLYELFK
ncbi:alkaline phosphatase family protein [Alteromonas gracilis]|uniref:alkaline phosphatase family protein n=1 Tax=Alteromonas gracilis TaxID=1479524 RepID=UPI0037367FB5